MSALPQRQLILAIICLGAVCFPFELHSQGTPKVELVVQTGHQDGINRLACSPSIGVAATGDTRGQIKLWEIETGRELRSIMGGADIRELDFSADGKHLLSVDGKGRMALWDPATGRLIRSLSDCCESTAKFLPNSNQVVSAGGTSDVFLWDVATGQKNRNFHAKPGSLDQSTETVAIATSSNGHHVATFGVRGDLRVWNIAAGQEIWAIVSHKKGHNFQYGGSVTFSRDGRYIVTGDGEHGEKRKFAKVYDVTSGREIRSLSGNGVISSLAVSADGRHVIGARDGIEIWELASGLRVRRLNTMPEVVDPAALGVVVERMAVCFSDLGMRDAAVLLVIVDPANRAGVPLTWIIDAYGLTPAEAKVALASSSGFTIPEVANQLGLSPNTIKTHLRKVFAKTGTSRQVELARLMASIGLLKANGKAVEDGG